MRRICIWHSAGIGAQCCVGGPKRPAQLGARFEEQRDAGLITEKGEGRERCCRHVIFCRRVRVQEDFSSYTLKRFVDEDFGVQVLLNLCASLIMSQVMFLIAPAATGDLDGCKCVSILLNYFVQVSFAWMLAEAAESRMSPEPTLTSGSNTRMSSTIPCLKENIAASSKASSVPLSRKTMTTGDIMAMFP